MLFGRASILLSHNQSFSKFFRFPISSGISLILFSPKHNQLKLRSFVKLLGNKGKAKCPKCNKVLMMQKLPKEIPFKQIRIQKEWEGMRQDDVTEVLRLIDTIEYSDILNNLVEITTCYQLIFITENILRRFIQKILTKEGFPQIKNLHDKKFNKSIGDFKTKDLKQKYLPLRGDHDIFYLNFIELKRFFTKYWEYFKNIFESQTWINQRIEDLYNIRNRVAHNSYLLTEDELNSVKLYSKQIITQISD